MESTNDKTDTVTKKDYRKAFEVVVKTQKASVSHLQRRMRIGYIHATSLIDELVANGVIAPAKNDTGWKVLVERLPESQMAEIEVTISLSFDELTALRQLADEGDCDVNDVVSMFVRERIAKD